MNKKVILLICVFAISVSSSIFSRTSQECIDALKYGTEEERIEAVKCLAEIGDKTNVTTLISTLKTDTSFLVRSEAALALGMLQDKQALQPLLDALKEREIRKNAILALGMLQDKQALPALLHILKKDKNEDNRENAAIALGWIEDKSAIEPLIEALQDESPYVRRASAEALGTFKDNIAGPALCSLLSDSDEDVRYAAAFALGNLTYIQAVAPLVNLSSDQSQKVQIGAAYSLYKFGDKNKLDVILEGLKSKDLEVKKIALYVLGDLSVDTTIPNIVEVANDEEEDLEVREYAREILQVIKEKIAESAAKPAKGKLEEKRVRKGRIEEWEEVEIETKRAKKKATKKTTSSTSTKKKTTTTKPPAK